MTTELITTTATPENKILAAISNPQLKRASLEVFECAGTAGLMLYKIAAIIADVDAKELWKDDGFASVHEWTEKTFGMKKSNSYAFLKIGNEYLNESGDGSNLYFTTPNDFTMSQVRALLPLGSELAHDVAAVGEVTPEMSVRDINDYVKEHRPRKMSTTDNSADTESVEEQDPGAFDETTPDDATLEDMEATAPETMVKVRNKYGKFEIPLSVLMKYVVEG